MSDLNFRVVVVPEEQLNKQKEQDLLLLVKRMLECCGLVVTFISISQVKKSDDDDYPEIEELAFEVQARSRTSSYVQKALLYDEFCSRWEKGSCSLPCSYIEFYRNDFFVNPRRTHHKVTYNGIAFGVLPHNGLFYQFAELNMPTTNTISFYHDTRHVVIEYKEFQMTFSYDNIRTVFNNISNPREMYLDLFNPPIINRLEKGSFLRPYLIPLKYRNLNIMPAGLTCISSASQPAIETDVLGRSSVLCLMFKDSVELREILSSIHYHCSEKSVYFSKITTVERTKPPDPVVEHMQFGCSYLVTAILQRNFVAVSQASDVNYNLRRLYTLSQQSPESLERALTSVLMALDSGKIMNYWHAIDRQYAYYSSNRDEIRFQDYIVPPKCRMIRRITITPTRQLLWPPEIMYGNRILRKFDSEYALRVSFRDDNMSRISFTAWRSDPGVFESCITKPMTNGVRIGSRKYEFLAWSNSQIRDHGVWMYAKDISGKTAAHIRQWMGNFSHIRNVPKYMARMGQCFSQTEDALSVPLDPQHVKTEGDIERGFNPADGKPYCFSDGVGRISRELAAKVHKALGHDRLCSAFQIRYGGYKGMLVVDPTLTGEQIVFRKSMKKFDCPNSTRLEIARTSGPVPLQLNRPFITLLDGLGVQRRMFSRLQEDMLQMLTAILFDENVAAKFLQSKTPSNIYNYQDLSTSGIHLTTEPFFKSVLLALHRHHIEKIKMRANIAVDPKKGRNMLGVMDEYRKLAYGQVFVQYSRDVLYGETTKDTVIVRGEVLVTKNPCMNPGDVRKFEAVDVPELHHIVDCIVFPQTGPRPHPNEMAGSDLDGDEYAVLWTPELIFDRNNCPAADFPAVHSPDVSCITVQHMIEFLQNYIKNDHVGAIANAHLAHADDKGIFSSICLNIAKKFSIAVDFAKNGQSKELDREERPQRYPDFMEKYTGEIYKSEKALGKMYRVCRDFESENQATSINYDNVKVDPDLVYDGWETYKENAVKSRNKYNALFRSVLSNYGIQHEAEALSGAFTNLHCRFHERKDRDEIEKVIVGCIKRLNKCMLDEFLEEFLVSGDVARCEIRMLQKASAWYVVTYSDPNAKFLTFPWAVSKYLANIKIQRTLGKMSPFSPAIANMDQDITVWESKNLLPRYAETGIWNLYNIECDPRIVKSALRTLMLWAQDVEVIEKPGENTQGLIYVSVFVKLFLHVAEMFGYVTRTNSSKKTSVSHFSPGNLCIEFLRFCSTFRFYNRTEIDELLSFNVYKYSKLAKRAIVTYHTFALTGKLQSLNFDKRIDNELTEMKPRMIDSKIFGRSPIDKARLQKAKDALLKYSRVAELDLREILQTKKVCVSARGTEQALKELKSILGKKHVVLHELFNTGILQEKK